MTKSTTLMDMARQATIARVAVDDSIGMTAPGSYDFLEVVKDPETGAEVEIFTTVKVTAHKFVATDKTVPYDGFQAVKDYEDEVATKAAEKEAKAKAKADKEAAKASRSRSRTKAIEADEG